MSRHNKRPIESMIQPYEQHRLKMPDLTQFRSPLRIKEGRAKDYSSSPYKSPLKCTINDLITEYKKREASKQRKKSLDSITCRHSKPEPEAIAFSSTKSSFAKCRSYKTIR